MMFKTRLLSLVFAGLAWCSLDGASIHENRSSSLWAPAIVPTPYGGVAAIPATPADTYAARSAAKAATAAAAADAAAYANPYTSYAAKKRAEAAAAAYPY